MWLDALPSFPADRPTPDTHIKESNLSRPWLCPCFETAGRLEFARAGVVGGAARLFH